MSDEKKVTRDNLHEMLGEAYKQLGSIWQRAIALVEQTGIKPSDAAYGEVLGLALEQVEAGGNPSMYAQGRQAGIYEAELLAQVDLREAVEKEREECALLAVEAQSDFYALMEEGGNSLYTQKESVVARRIVTAIRARGEVKAHAPVNGTYTMSVMKVRNGSLTIPPMTFSPAIPVKSVSVDGVYYLIDDVGIGRCRDSEVDRVFAEPIAAYLAEKGLNAGNIKSITYDKNQDAVFYQWLAVNLAYMVNLGVWSQPLERSDYERACADYSSYRIENPLAIWKADKLPSFDANGIPVASPCARCGGALGSRVAVCEKCEPTRE